VNVCVIYVSAHNFVYVIYVNFVYVIYVNLCDSCELM
jgi:hypothetical protein